MTESLVFLTALFLTGLAGSMHCVGMCGGFACAIGGDARGGVATWQRQLVYNAGRVTTYCFLGAVVGHLGFLLVALCGDDSVVSLVQRGLAVLSGALMVFIGLQFFGLFRLRGAVGLGGEVLSRALRDLLKAPGVGAPLAFGVLNGFLPCPLVYAVAAQAAASGGAWPGFLTMAAFGLGTFPAMLLIAGIGVWWRRGPRAAQVQPVHASFLRAARTTVVTDWRHHGVRLAGAFIVLLGVITFARGALPLAGHVHGLG
ncbi:MAG TPA: sulfite exporter TauE/SafE family protein [Burkholderiaceae bacterium]|nr:sulfite exporter TauE/SafE family protein [Burkholderiaceae bacterium]